MRTFAVASILGIVLSCAGDARGEGYKPSYERIRARLEQEPVTLRSLAPTITRGQLTGGGPGPTRPAPSAAAARRNRLQTSGRDSVWNGLLIGAGIGAGGGYVWARNICGSNDAECFAITRRVGVLGGAGIGAAVGAMLDALQK
jgi:hypothetical protein